MQSPEQVAAALVSPWPTWLVEAPTEQELLERVTSCGPVPQAVLFEPWDDEPWTARILFPPLDRAADLLRSGRLEPGESPGFTEWSDRDRISEDVLSVDGMRASLLSDTTRGEVLLPRMRHHEADALTATFRSHIGSDDAWATRVTQLPTGRPGVHFEAAVRDADTLAERTAVLQAVADTLEGADPAFARDARWWFELGRIHVVAWRILPATPSFPTAPWTTASVNLERWRGHGELQVLLPDADHEPSALAISDTLAETRLSGSRPRWIEGRFVACWTGPADTSVPALDPPHRWVPGVAPGLEDDAPGLDTAVWVAGFRAFLQSTCGLRGRDLLPRCQARDGDSIDKAIAHRLSALGALEPVDAGFFGLRLRLPALDTDAWEAVLLALGHLPVDAIGPVVYVRMDEKHFTLLLERTDRDAEPSTWSIL